MREKIWDCAAEKPECEPVRVPVLQARSPCHSSTGLFSKGNQKNIAPAGTVCNSSDVLVANLLAKVNEKTDRKAPRRGILNGKIVRTLHRRLQCARRH